MASSFVRLNIKLKILFFLFLAFSFQQNYAQIYQHNFGTSTISAHPYTEPPTFIDPNLSNSSWTNTTATWSDGAGNTGRAIRLSCDQTPATTTITLTFNVSTNYQVSITSFDFWRVRSNTGAQNWAMKINGIDVGNGTIPTSGAAIGFPSVTNPIAGLTGTVTVQLILSGASGTAGTFRLDDFTLNGSVTTTCVQPTITSFFPILGPRNTVVEITGNGFQAGTGTSSVKFNGVEATSFNVISNTLLEAVVPTNATTGLISITTNNCTGLSIAPFTIINSTYNNVYSSDIYISEVYDAQVGDGGIFEIYNGTNSAKDLSLYTLERYGDIGGALGYTIQLSGTLQPGQFYLIGIGGNVPCGITPDLAYATGFNASDEFKLYNNGVLIDNVQAPNEVGYTIIRSLTAIAPKTAFDAADWTISSTESCTDIGMHAPTTTIPTASVNPVNRNICENKSTTFTTTLNAGLTYTYQWKVLTAANTWVNVVDNANYSGATSYILTVSNAPASFNKNQYYCEVNSTSFKIISNAVQLVVNPLVTPTFTQVNAICPGTTLSALPTTSAEGIAGTWSPALNNLATTLYTFTPTAGQCAANATMTITVNSNSTPTFTQVNAICPGATLSALPTTSTEGIAGTWSPALNNLATTLYTFTPTAGQCASNATMTITVNSTSTPTFTQVTAICAGAPLSALLTTSTEGIVGTWSPALNNLTTTLYTFTPTASQCASNATMTITVNSNNTPTFTQITAICPGDALSPLPTTSTEGIAGTWSPALNNLTTTLYTFTTTAGQCASNATMTITVNSNSTPTFTQVNTICPGATLSALPTTSTDGIVGTWSPTLNNMATTLYTFTPTAGQCAANATMTITVSSLPKEPKITITQPSCANPFGTIKINPPFDPSYSYSIDNINYQSTPIFENLDQGSYDVTARNYYGCTSTIKIAIINNTPIVPVAPTLISTDPTCLNSRGSIEVTAPLGTGFSYSINGINFQSATTFNNLDSDDYNLYVKNLDGCISNPTSITINMVPQPISTRESYYYCVDKNNVTLSPAKIDTGLSPLDYSFYWTFNGNTIANTTKELDASKEGIYRVEATNLLTGCEIHLTATVKKSSPATATATVGIDFDFVQTITVNITSGISEYLYQLNEGPFQESNVFNIYLGGIYTITVMDKNGCNDFVFKVEAYNFPRFFTPNGDGYNDFWNITEIPNPAKSTILIFDRMGKLLKQISPTGAGWDGTFVGKPMPATDYWFVLKYEDVNGSQKEFKSHFALKR